MKAPQPIWETIYAHDRRKSRHRCRCCARILKDGDAAIMARVEGRATWAIHAECGKIQHGLSTQTWREAMEHWGRDYLRACGWKLSVAA